MKQKINLSLCAIAIAIISGPALAEDYEYHPVISDSFSFVLGAMRSSNSFKLESDAFGDIGDVIDFDDSLHVDDSSTFLNAQFRWKFGKEKKWSLFGQYFGNNATGSVVLTKDIEWDGITFREGTNVESGVELDVWRVFVGRSFIRNERHDFGIGAGIHTLDMGAFVEGEIIIDDESTGFQRGDVGVSQPLPNIGAWYNFSPSKRWLLHARVDWISANIGDYDGALWNTSIGVNFQAWRHIGIDLSWQYFNVNVNVDSDDWVGGADLTYSGPVLGLTGTW